jgi:hypothetical protein
MRLLLAGQCGAGRAPGCKRGAIVACGCVAKGQERIAIDVAMAAGSIAVGASTHRKGPREKVARVTFQVQDSQVITIPGQTKALSINKLDI